MLNMFLHVHYGAMQPHDSLRDFFSVLVCLVPSCLYSPADMRLCDWAFWNSWAWSASFLCAGAGSAAISCLHCLI
jgi:hypothetical protein